MILQPTMSMDQISASQPRHGAGIILSLIDRGILDLVGVVLTALLLY
jgi:hypothetical protein